MVKRCLFFLFCVVFLGIQSVLADDTDIYGVSQIAVEPNVLIIFDTSGSMDTEDVPGEYYDSDSVYSGSYGTNKVYEQLSAGCGGDVFELFASDVNDLNCQDIKDSLLTDGLTTGEIRDQSNNFNCGGSERDLFLGNWLNYDESGTGDDRRRIEVAKEVISDLIADTDNVRFGLMRFNTSGDGDEGWSDDDGGQIVADCGTDKATLNATVNAFTADGFTPLAETLAEAGLYFAGETSWYNSGTYTSPIQYRCQNNYIILMTDGEPTYDSDPDLTDAAYIDGSSIGDYDQDSNDPGSYGSEGSDYLDDVAKYLYENDCNLSLGSVGDFEKQTITVYTIGFQTDQELLSDTAVNGGGAYYTANNISGLSAAFQKIISEIEEKNAVFVAPVVPVSKLSQAYAGDYIYIGFFQPQSSGRWYGNIKKYGLDEDGDLLDADGLDATTSDGTIKGNVRSYWSISADGADVDDGGAGESLLHQGSRNIYTYLGTQSNLTHSDNEFDTNNNALTAGLLGVGTNSSRNELINEVIGTNSTWIFGDVIHSEPKVVHYDTNSNGVLDSSYLYVGSNDGIMHCISDNDGSEVWGFIPPDQLDRLQLLQNNDHDYLLDGALSLYEGSAQKILFFGERRAGDHYYALDVTSYDQPAWMYSVNPDILGGGNATLGQSWSHSEPFEIRTGSGSDTVFLLTGGYDTNQDQGSPSNTDSVGRSVFTVNVSDGSLSVLNYHADNYTAMTHCIVDLTGFDANGDGYLNRVYAGDLGGNCFAFEDPDQSGTWTKRRLFSAKADENATVQRKIFGSPDAVKEPYGEMIFFGTGDRADPQENATINRFYAVKNDWEWSNATQETFDTLHEDDLVDVTDDLIQMGNATQQAEVATELENGDGWFIRLEHSGEKVVSSPTVFGGVVYFTTFTPGSGGGGGGDLCSSTTDSGVARLYAVDYQTGGAVHDYYDVDETDAEGEVIERGKLDRSKVVGTAIPSKPVIAISETGPQMYIGKEEGVAPEDTVDIPAVELFYWRQIF